MIKPPYQAIRLHLCFELNRMMPARFLVDTGQSNEKKALLQMLEAGVTSMADRGYLSFPRLGRRLERLRPSSSPLRSAKS